MKPAVAGLLIVLGVGVGFGTGYYFRNYQITKLRGNFTMNGANGNFQRFNGTTRGGSQGMMRAGGANGSIISMDDKSITVKMQDGSTRIVLFADSTTYLNTATVTKSDLKTGSDVMVFGTPNSDGSLTASSILLNPTMFKSQVDPTPQSK